MGLSTVSHGGKDQGVRDIFVEMIDCQKRLIDDVKFIRNAKGQILL